MELLVVIAIISFIASLSLPVLNKARKKALITRTKATINTLEVALSMYENDFGDYPYGDGNDSKVLTELLIGPVENERWNGPYIRLKKEEMDENGNILDGWKSPIVYKYPQSEYSNVPFLLISPGPDRKLGTADDIGNW